MQLYHISINNLRRRLAKMIFVLLGVTIGIATITSVNGVVEAMKYEMTRQVTEFGVNVVITPDAGGLTLSYGGITLPEIMYDVHQLSNEDILALEGVPSSRMIRAVAPKLMGFANLNDSHNRVMVVGANLKEEFTLKPWLRLTELTMPAEEVSQGDNKGEFTELDLSRQDLELLTLDDKLIIVGATLADSLGLKKGDALKLVGSQFEVFAVLVESGTREDQQVMMNLAAAQLLLARPGEITVIELAVDYFSGSEEGLLSEIKEALPHTQTTSLRQETLRRDEMLTRLVRFGLSVSILILLVGTLVAGLTMAGAVRERTREIGVFRALGFRKIHIAKMIVLEGTLVSTVGGFLGWFVGTLIARYNGALFAGMDIQVPWRIDLLLTMVGLAIAIGILSSLYPAWLAAKQDPVDALRFI